VAASINIPDESNPHTDAFVFKYDVDGNEVWTRQFGHGNGLGISVNASGVYLVGRTGPNAFVRKYDVDGNEVWTRQFTTPEGGSFGGTGISVDASGVYVAGDTFGAFPGQHSAGGIDGFVRKYDVDGNEVWTRQFGTPTHDFHTVISVNASGVYVVGFTFAGDGDAVGRQFDADGNEVWAHQFETPAFDFPLGISADASGVYVVGYTHGTLPGQTSAGDDDAFVLKFRSSMTPTPQDALQTLICQVEAFNLKQGIANSLDAKLEAAMLALEDMNANNNVAAINALEVFINSVEAQRGNEISDADADTLIASAQAIITQLTTP
jgi:hypothetical protein